MAQLSKAAQARLDGIRYIAGLVGQWEDTTLAREWQRVVSAVDVLAPLGMGKDWRSAVEVAKAQLSTASDEVVEGMGLVHVMMVLVELAGHVGR